MFKNLLQTTWIMQFRTAWLLGIFCCFGFGSVQGQIAVTVTNPTNATPNLATNYTSLLDALTALNATTAMSGSVTLTLAAGQNETAPTAAGFVLGSATLNPVLSVTNTITIIKATGAATVLNAAPGGVATPTSATPDGIFSIRGADFVTIDGLTFTDGNVANPATMEFGLGLFKAGAGDGANNNTIQNCIFNMQRINNASTTAPMVEGSVGILVINSTAVAATTPLTPTNGGTSATNGTNSNNRFYTNTINGGNYGIALSGFAATVGVGPTPTATTFLGDLGNDIGGTAVGTGNTILNFGGAAAATNPSAGIRANNQWSVNIRFNVVDNNNGSGVNHVTTLRGIFAQAGTSATATISDNNVTVRSGATTSALTAIENGIGSTASSNTINVNNNTIRFSYATATSGVFIGVSNSSTAASVNINTNNIQQLASTNYPTTGIVPVIVGGSPGGTLNINNNTISNFNMTGASGTLRAITASTPTGLYTCTGNTITNLSYATVGSTGSITGIFNVGSATLQNWNNNIISNFSTPSTGTLNGIQNNTVAGTFQCRNNQIFNFTTTVGGAGGFSANGITWSNANVDISGNIIFAINSTGTTGGTGGTINGITNLGAATITRNAIYNLSSNSTNVTIAGININATGTNTVSNNLVGDLRAPNSTGNVSISGIVVASGTTNNIFHNTVNIAATTTSTTTFGTSAIYFSSSTPVNNVRNNIFVNTSSSGTTGGFAASIRYIAAPTSANFPATNNNNLYFSGTPSATKLIYGETGAATPTNPQQTLANYKTYISTTLPVAGRESASISENPLFVSTSGTNPITDFLKYDVSVSLQIEQGGGLGTGVTTDYTGTTTRCPGGGCPGAVSAPDIGAWELNGIPLDLTPPIITYTPLLNICASTPSRVLVATITDASGVPTSGAGLPMLYWRLNAGGYTGVQGVSLGSGQYQFTFGTATVTNDVISYYIVAQDAATTPNIGSFPISGASGFTVNPPAATVPPTTPTTYTQLPSLSGTYLVGAGQTYTTLTAAVNAYNTLCLSGPVTFALTDATYSGSETFPIVINANSFASVTNTLTIRPNTGITSTISGNNAGTLIRLNGARFVTIEGSNTVGGTTRDLTITNTNTTSPNAVSIVSLGAGAGTVNSAIRNCNISTGVVVSATTYGIAIGGLTPGTSGADNDNITIQNNAITVATVGVYASGTASVSAGGMDNLNVVNNSVNTVNTSSTVIGIQVANALNSAVTANTVSVETNASVQPVGISLETGFVSSTVTQNTITKVLTTATGGYAGRGITIGTGTATSNLTVANNVVYGVNGSNWSSFGNSSSMGIAVGIVGTSTTLTTTAGGINLYYNSVNMTGSMGTGSAAAITTALYVGSGASALNIQNNIFVNTQVATNTGQKNYAIYSAVANTAFSNINNNNYFVSNTANAASAVLGFLTSDRTDLAGVVTGFGQNANSLNTDPLFTSSTNLLPISVLLDNKGTVIAGITTDIINTTRSATTPDVGAYEFVGVDLVPPVITYTALSSVCTSTPSRTLVATITDISGVPTSGAGLPRLYWRLNAGAYTSVQAISLGGNQYQFTFGGATVPNDVISYYVVAQDNFSTPNVTSFPALGASGFSTNPPVATTPPTTPSFYIHGPGLAGTYTVGVSGNYPTLTAAITAFNGGCANNAVIFELIDTSYPSETFPIVINQIPNASTNTLIIRPSASVGAVNLVGNNSTSLIDLNGADYVTINGINGTSTLTISNTAVGATANTIRLFGDATFNTITNATVLGSGNVLGAAVINVGSVVATGNNNNTISNNTIGAAGANFPITGVISFSGSAINNSQNTLTGNNFADIFNADASFSAININNGNTAWTINNNKIYQTTPKTITTGSTSTGITVTSGTGYTINGNIIGFADASSNGTTTYTSTLVFSYTPIAISGLVVGTVNNIQGNTITAISITTASTATMFNGIFLAGAGDVNVGTITPNIIGAASGTDAISVTASATGGTFFGIRNTATGTINISNNVIGSMTALGTSASVALSVQAINSNAGTNNITGNAIGSIDTPNSINSSTVATVGTQNVAGIIVTTTLPTNISNNVITNLNQASTTTGAFVRGIHHSGSGNATINGNTVSNLFGANTNTTQTGITGVTGIASTGFATNVTINQNTVFALANVNSGAVATSVLGIGYGNATSAVISKNKVYDIRNASTMTTITTPPTSVGIMLRTGGATVVNNMVSLGDVENTNTTFIGISNNATSASNLNIYHNSVYIGGVANAGALPSFGFLRSDFSATVITTPVDIRNNIFSNLRSGGTGLHYAIGNNFGATASATGWGANASNYNVLYASVAANTGHWTAALDFAAWKTASASDANSLNVVITFVDTPNGDLHIAPPYANPFDGLGINIPSVTDDFDGQARASNTPVDIGADAGSFFNYPTITYTPLSNNCSVGARLLVANIVNSNGVPTSGAGLPRLYWRINAGAYQSSVATSLGSGNYEFSLGAGSVLNDVISYYIVAQDIVGNVGSAPALGASGFTINPPAASTPPTTPSSYTNIPTLSGTYLVGAGQTYTTLTAAVNAYNTNCLGGPVTFALTDATYSGSETFPIVINASPFASATNTLTIRPNTGVTSTISGNNASTLIRLNGARFVNIDGSNTVGGTTKNLTITNTNTTSPNAVSIVSLGAGAGTVNSAIRNCNISTGVVVSATTYGIAIGGLTPGTSGADNDNITIQNNAITVATVGVYASGTASVSAGGMDNLNVVNNSVNTVNTSSTVIGIQVANALNSAVTANTVSVETNASVQPVGISLETGFVSSTVTQNTITKSLTTNTGGYAGRGITIGTGTATSNLTVANNVIYGVNGTNWSGFSNSSSIGIAVGIIGTSTTLTTTAGGINLYYNAVNMSGTMGTASATSITTALYVGSGASALNIQNNVFVNTQVATSTTQKNYAIYSDALNTAFSNINNNAYFVSNTFNAPSAVLGFIGGDRTNLAGIVTGFGQNANSVNADPLFASATNLIPASCALDNKAATIAGITTDFSGVTRSATPDIGAYEFASVLTVSPATLPNATLSSAYTQTLTQTGIPGTLTWSVSAGTLPTGITLSATGSLSGTPLLAGTFNFTAQVTDGVCTTTRAYTLVVDCPVTTILPATLPNATLGSAYTQTITTTLIGTITWSVSAGTLPTGLSLNASTGVLSGTPTVGGVFNFTVSVSSNVGCSATPMPYTLTVDCPTMTITTASFPNGILGTVYTTTTLAQTGLPTPAWSVSAGTLPTGLSLNASTGDVSGTPTALGTFNFTIQAQQSTCNVTKAFSIVIGCPTITFTNTTASSGVVGVAYTLSAGATGNTATLTYSVSPTLPAGLTLDTATGAISGTPTTVTASATYTVTASQAGPCSITQAYTFAVGCPTITFVNTTATSATVGTAYSIDASVTGNTTTVTYSVSPALPAGLNLSTSTGQITGTPTTATASATYTITASQSGTCSATQNYTFAVNCPTIVFTVTTASAGTVGVAYLLNAGVTGNTTAITYSVSPALPAGLTLDTATGAISGTPTAVTASATYTVTASQTGCSVTQVYTFAIGCPALTFNSASATTATVGTAYTLNAGVTGTSLAVTYSVSPALPTGLSLNTATGAITGTPTTTTASATYTVTATHSVSCTATQAYTFAVGCPTITMLPATLPDAIVNTPYSQTLSTTGLAGTYTWALTAGIMPTGLTLNTSTGEISGTPTILGTNNVTFTATHTSGCSVTLLYALDVVNLPSFTTQPTNASVCPNTTATFTVVVSSFDPATVQWEEKIGSGAFTALTNVAPYSGVATTTLTISNATVAMSGRQYRCVATNPSGTTISDVATLTSTDLVNPVLTVPANITFNASAGNVASCGQVVTYTLPTATDNCTASGAIVINQTAGLASGATFPLGVTTVTFTATDQQGNVDTKSFTVTVVDNVQPTVITQNISKVLGVGNTVSITAAEINNGSTDNCAGTLTYSVSPNTFNCTNLGANTVTLTVTDANGNTHTNTATVTITENVAPVLTLPTNITVNTDTNLCSAVVNYTVSATDNCTASGSITLNRTTGLASGSAFPKGITTVTYTATDASGNVSAPQSFTVTVNDAQLPALVACPANIVVNNTAGLNSAIVTYTAPTTTDNCSGATVARIAGLASGSTFPVGVTTVTHEATDAANNKVSCSFTVTVNFVNSAPTFTASTPATVLEDAGAQSIANWATGNDNDEAIQTLSYEIGTIGTPSLFSVAPAVSATGTLTYTPAPNANGTSTFQVRIRDNGGVANGGVDVSAFQTFTITVTSVNDAPSFTASNPPAVNEDAGAQTVTGWVTTASAGPADENTQTLSYGIGTIGTPSLFSVAPVVSATGTLTYTPAPNAFGTSTVQVRIMDNGGTANAGVDMSVFQTFTITVGNINDAPSFTASTPPTVLEDAGAQSVANFVTASSAGPANESAQALNYEMGTVGTPSLFSVAPAVSATGTLTYTPAPNANGTSTFQVRIKDDGGVANGGVDMSAFQTFTITITAVNDAPSFTVSNPPAVNEDAGAQTVTGLVTTNSAGPANESTQTLIYEIGTISNPALFSASPAISATGTLTYTPATDAFGTSTVQVRIRDNGGVANGGVDVSAFQTFTITVNNINDAPSFTAIANIPASLEDQAVNIPAFVTSTNTGSPNENSQTISYEIGTISNTALFSAAPTVSASGTLAYTPAPNANGTSTFQVRIRDNGGVANGGIDVSAFQTFTINVTPVNDEPTLASVANFEQIVGSTITVNLTGIAAGGGTDESTQTFTVIPVATSGASVVEFPTTPIIVSGGNATFGIKLLTAGDATIRVTVRDNGGVLNGGDDSVERIFTIKANIQAQAFVPTIFSPNGDGDNDKFRVKVAKGAVETLKLEIFNDRGDRVFYSDVIEKIVEEGWDGKYNNIEQPQGVYGWKLSGKFKDGRDIKATDGERNNVNKGNINLIRGTK